MVTSSRGCRLVRDPQCRIACQRHRDHHPLPHAAGQTVWKVIRSGSAGKRSAVVSKWTTWREAAALWLLICARHRALNRCQTRTINVEPRDGSEKTDCIGMLAGRKTTRR